MWITNSFLHCVLLFTIIHSTAAFHLPRCNHTLNCKLYGHRDVSGPKHRSMELKMNTDVDDMRRLEERMGMINQKADSIVCKTKVDLREIPAKVWTFTIINSILIAAILGFIAFTSSITTPQVFLVPFFIPLVFIFWERSNNPTILQKLESSEFESNMNEYTDLAQCAEKLNVRVRNLSTELKNDLLRLNTKLWILLIACYVLYASCLAMYYWEYKASPVTLLLTLRLLFAHGKLSFPKRGSSHAAVYLSFLELSNSIDDHDENESMQCKIGKNVDMINDGVLKLEKAVQDDVGQLENKLMWLKNVCSLTVGVVILVVVPYSCIVLLDIPHKVR
jgi:hypothetical protein